MTTMTTRDQRIQGRRIIASVSGGKDSGALSLHLRELGIEHDRVFMDTGWESDITYEYLRTTLPRVIGPITWISGPLQMEELVLKKGMFPSRVRRFCTEDLKVRPMIAHIGAIQDAGEECVNAVGIRAAESEARRHLAEWEWSDTFDCWVWRPLIGWSEQDVIDIHRRHGLSPNPLYLQDASRVGCWPCIFARKSEIRHIAAKDPARIVRLRMLEADVDAAADARWMAKLRKWAWLSIDEQINLRAAGKGPQPRRGAPAWFQAPIGKDGACWPIDRVVEWSRTVRGGKEEDRQESLFAGLGDGCMRWGMCE